MSDEAAEYLLTLAEKNGVATATVKDGHVLIFKRDYLKRMLEADNADTFTIFVKRQVSS